MRRPLVVVVVLFATLLCRGRSSPADEISGELVGLNVSLAAEKQLVVHDQLVAAENWAAALDLLDRLRVDGGDALVKVSPGRFVGLPVAIQQRLCRLPAAGLEVYRRRHNAGASTRLSRARLEHDEVALWRIVDDSIATRAAHAAIDDLAAQAASRGDLELALRLWGRLWKERSDTPRVFPTPMFALTTTDSESSPSAQVKSVVARHRVGVPLSAEELTTLGSDSKESWNLAGQPVRELLMDSTAAPARETSIGSLRWSTMATPNCRLPDFQAPQSVTLGRGGLLLIHSGSVIRALNAESGEPYWPTELSDDAGVVVEDEIVFGEPNHEVPCRIAGGVCSSDRYFGVMGEAPRWRPRPGLVPLSGALLALDLDQGEGRVRWRVESRDLPEPEWLFHGSPVLSRGHLTSEDLVLVPLCRPAPQVELAVAAFSQDDGHFVWWTRIGTCAADAGQPLANSQLLTRAGLVVARTSTGVIVALDVRQGRVQWASTAMVASPPKQRGSHTPLIDCRAGVLVVGDPVQSQVAGFSLDNGEELWRQDLAFPIHGVVCPPQGQALIAGSRVRSVSLLRGTPLWEFGTDDSSAAGAGVPVVDGATVLWPTRTGIWGLELTTGTIEFERRLFTGPVAAPIQLTQAHTHWIISRPDSILCLQRDGAAGP